MFIATGRLFFSLRQERHVLCFPRVMALLRSAFSYFLSGYKHVAPLEQGAR